MVAPRRRPPPPPRRRPPDSTTKIRRLVEDEEEREQPFDPRQPPIPYAQRHHFAVNSVPEVFDLEAEGIALPGHLIRGLGEYAQGDGAARALYVKATDLDLVSNQEILEAATELQEQNEALSSSELDKLVAALMRVAHAEGGDEDDADDLAIDFFLTDKEEESLAYIADRYTSARILLDGYDPEAMTILRSDARDAFLATRGDGGDLGIVPLAGGTLCKKIFQLWDEAEAMSYAIELLDLGEG